MSAHLKPPVSPIPLFAWGAANHRSPRNPARLYLRADLRDAEGEPRACIAAPGEPLRAYPSLPAALAALRDMEARRHDGQ